MDSRPNDATIISPRGPESPARPAPQIPDHVMLRRIGSGAYGEVWLARTVTDQFRAVKVVYRDAFRDERPFQREFAGVQKAEPVSRSHDGLLQILHVGRNEPAGFFFYSMELADDLEQGTQIAPDSYIAKTLADHVRLRGRLPLRDFLPLGISLALALDHLHRHGLVHRDVKPANILFVRGSVKLGDVGLVVGVTEARTFVGTEGYIPPEGPGSPQADVYSLGKVFRQVVGTDHSSPSEAESAGSQDTALDRILERACQPEARKRYQTAADVAADLRAVQDGTFVPQKQSRRRRAALNWIGCALLAVVVAAVAILWSRRVETPTPSPAAVLPAPAAPAKSRAISPTFGYFTDEGKTIAGYRIEGDKINFELDMVKKFRCWGKFDHLDQPAGTRPLDVLTLEPDRGTSFDFPIYEVSVVGDFNEWKPHVWRMARVGRLRYLLTKDLSDVSSRREHEFGFVLNDSIRIAPALASNSRPTSGPYEKRNLLLTLP